jgi:hypothetical protein
MEIISAITFGLITGFHCIGMCGPIAISLPLINQSWFSRTTSALLYNFGRTVTYSAMGAVFGLLGKGFQLFGILQWVSIATGIIMILTVLFPLLFRKHFQAEGIVSKWTSGLKSAFRKMFLKRSYSSLFVIGLINGLLPCGPVYMMAMAGAAVTGSVTGGAIYMLAFGLGTIPMMLSLSLFGNIISTRFRNTIRKVIPVFIVILGILFILRGMGLGIKYISPKLNAHNPEKVECCH